MKMLIITIDYPSFASFTIRAGKFKNNNDLKSRTKELHRLLKRSRVDSPCHDYSDYVVEGVEITSNGREFWVVGS